MASQAGLPPECAVPVYSSPSGHTDFYCSSGWGLRIKRSRQAPTSVFNVSEFPMKKLLNSFAHRVRRQLGGLMTAPGVIRQFRGPGRAPRPSRARPQSPGGGSRGTRGLSPRRDRVRRAGSLAEHPALRISAPPRSHPLVCRGSAWPAPQVGNSRLRGPGVSLPHF